MRPFEIQLPCFIQDLINNMDVCVRTKVLLIDFYKTYEMFSHQGLIRRLEYYRVRGQGNKSINWMSNKTTMRHFHSSHNAPLIIISRGITALPREILKTMLMQNSAGK